MPSLPVLPWRCARCRRGLSVGRHLAGWPVDGRHEPSLWRTIVDPVDCVLSDIDPVGEFVGGDAAEQLVHHSHRQALAYLRRELQGVVDGCGHNRDLVDELFDSLGPEVRGSDMLTPCAVAWGRLGHLVAVGHR